MLLPDNSGLPDAPINGVLYGRKDEAWEPVAQNLNDLGDVDPTGLAPGKILKWDGFMWVTSDDAGGIPDAPNSSNYVRSLNSWNLLSGTSELTAINSNVSNLQT